MRLRELETAEEQFLKANGWGLRKFGRSHAVHWLYPGSEELVSQEVALEVQRAQSTSQGLEALERAEQSYLRFNGWSRDLSTMRRPRSEQLWSPPESTVKLSQADGVRVLKAADRASVVHSRGAAHHG